MEPNDDVVDRIVRFERDAFDDRQARQGQIRELDSIQSVRHEQGGDAAPQLTAGLVSGTP